MLPHPQQQANTTDAISTLPHFHFNLAFLLIWVYAQLELKKVKFIHIIISLLSHHAARLGNFVKDWLQWAALNSYTWENCPPSVYL